MVAVRAGRNLPDDRFMVPCNLLVRQIHIIIPDCIVFGERIVKRCIQMIILPTDFNNIPRMTVLDSLFVIGLRQRNNTPDSKLITKDFNGFCHALTDGNTISQCPDNLVGILFF